MLNRSAATARASTTSAHSLAEAELAQYLTEAADSYTDSGVAFWRDRLKTYPQIAPVALDLVSIPASQAYVERAFSLCGDLCARKRNRASLTLERRVFLKLNKSLLC